MIKEIGEAIYNKLVDLTTTTTLNKVYNYDKQSSTEGFPYATISLGPGSEAIFDTQLNLAIVPYVVRIYEQSKDIENVEPKMRQLLDNILEAFRQDFTLGGLAEGGVEISINSGYVGDEQPLRVIEILLKYKVLITYK